MACVAYLYLLSGPLQKSLQLPTLTSQFRDERRNGIEVIFEETISDSFPELKNALAVREI